MTLSKAVFNPTMEMLNKQDVGGDSEVAPDPVFVSNNGIPRVSVIIVVWNAKRYVLECLESLLRHCGTVCSEVIVVDNASTDGAPQAVEELFPGVQLIRNPENYGFAKANNIGIARCSGDYICLVNSDVAFTGDCISPMLRYMAEHPSAAMLSPRMLGADGHVHRSTMRFPTLWNSFSRSLGLDQIFRHSRLFGGLLMADFNHQRTIPVEVLNGWFVVVRRQAMEKVGLLDPQFFMYGEDVDWCYRFRQAGERVVFFAGAEAIHYGGSSSSTAPIQFYLEQYRAHWLYWQKHHGWLSRAGFLFTLAIHHCLRIALSGCAYLCRPSERSETRIKLKRSLVCLRWVGQTGFKQRTLNSQV
jgi:GT2 family glycosyltransferase